MLSLLFFQILLKKVIIYNQLLQYLEDIILLFYTHSEFKNVPICIPQSFVIVPFHFIIDVNDLPKGTPLLPDVFMYADDIMLCCNWSDS